MCICAHARIVRTGCFTGPSASLASTALAQCLYCSHTLHPSHMKLEICACSHFAHTLLHSAPLCPTLTRSLLTCCTRDALNLHSALVCRHSIWKYVRCIKVRNADCLPKLKFAQYIVTWKPSARTPLSLPLSEHGTVCTHAALALRFSSACTASSARTLLFPCTKDMWKLLYAL